ncbi:MAG TPA: hypothetical protein VGK28_12965 [Candidatus Dormibacteraeota bacterium]
MSRGIEQLRALLGDWVADSKAFSEGRGHTIVTLTEDGKFMRIHSVEEDQRFPESLMIIGADEASDYCTVLYYDSRGVYRVYRTRLAGGEWTIWRDAPGFNQRYIGKLSEDGRSITGRWEMSEDGKSWKVDFDLNYTKVAGGHA